MGFGIFMPLRVSSLSRCHACVQHAALPPELVALFRPLCVTPPELLPIVQCFLAAQGFLNLKVLQLSYVFNIK